MACSTDDGTMVNPGDRRSFQPARPAIVIGHRPVESGPTRGNVLVAGLVLAIVILLAISSLDFLPRSDLSATASLIREMKATCLAESIAAQIESRVNRHPWEKRFWLLEAQRQGTITPGSGVVPQATFNKSTGHVNLSADTLSAPEYDFVGVVKDVNSGAKEYRIYAEVSYQDAHFTFSWDKRYQDSILGTLNQDLSLLDKQLEEAVANTAPTDQLLENIKASAQTPSASGLTHAFQRLLEDIQKDEKKLEGVTGAPVEPSGTPSLPQDPSPPNTLD